MGVSQTAARLLGRLVEPGVLRREQPSDNSFCEATIYNSRAPALFIITNPKPASPGVCPQGAGWSVPKPGELQADYP
jgi:hypothetical protein